MSIKLPFVVSLVVGLLGCQSPKKKEQQSGPPEDQEPQNSTGLIDGNGAEIRDREPFELPNRPEIDAFLAKLSGPEFLWVHLLRKPLQAAPNGVVIMASRSRCYLQVAPSVEVRAYFNKLTNTVTFCKPFFDANSADQLAIVLHELTHMALYDMLINLGDGEEDIVLLFESIYLKLASAVDDDASRKQMLELRALLDRVVPALYGVIHEVDAAEAIGAIDEVPIRKNGSATYPVPKGLYTENFFPPHHLKYMLNAYWTSNPHFKAAELLKEPGSALGSVTAPREFPHAQPLTAKRGYRARTLLLESAEGCSEPSCMPALSPTVIEGSEITDEFRKFLKSEHYGNGWIRTIDWFETLPEGKVRRDRVFFFDGI